MQATIIPIDTSRAEQFIKDMPKASIIDWFLNYPAGQRALEDLATELAKQDGRRHAAPEPPR